MSTITERIDAITHIPAVRLAKVIPAPKSVKVELTASCDFRCSFCATSYDLRKKGHMPLPFFKSISKEMRTAGVEELGLFYLGESMLYPHLAEAVEWAKKECSYPYVFLTTNGRLATPEKVTALFYAGLDSLKFSFNSADAKQMKEITQVDAFDRVVANIQAAKAKRDMVWDQTGHKCGLYASSILYDGEQGERMEKAVGLIRDYVDEHYWLPLYSQHTLTTGASEAKGFAPTAGNRGRVGGLVDPLPCWAVFSEGHITFDGKLTACCFSHTEEFTMADLSDTPFIEGWNSLAFQALRKAHLARDVGGTPCAGCVAYV